MNIRIQSIFNKSILATLTIISFGCGSSNPVVTTPLAESSPITAGQGTEQQTVRLGQSVIQLEMNHSEMEPVFETRDVPATCTRTVQRGTRRECHTENEQQCRNVSFPVCTNESENVCVNVPDQVCHNETRQQCDQITRRDCHVESHQQCHNETRQECTNVPHQECADVPVMAQEQYACTQQQQVAVGQRLKLHQLARLNISLVNPRNLDVSKDDLMLTMSQGKISGVVSSVTGIQYQVRELSKTENKTSETEELINISLEVDVM